MNCIYSTRLVLCEHNVAKFTYSTSACCLEINTSKFKLYTFDYRTVSSRPSDLIGWDSFCRLHQYGKQIYNKINWIIQPIRSKANTLMNKTSGRQWATSHNIHPIYHLRSGILLGWIVCKLGCRECLYKRVIESFTYSFQNTDVWLGLSQCQHLRSWPFESMCMWQEVGAEDCPRSENAKTCLHNFKLLVLSIEMCK